MKRSICTFFVLLLCVSLCACGKDEAVMEVEKLINQLPAIINLRMEQEILEAERAYDALTEKQAKKVENYEALANARRTYDELAAADPFTAAYWKLSDHDREFVKDMGLHCRMNYCTKKKLVNVEILEVWRDGEEYRIVTLEEGDTFYGVHSVELEPAGGSTWSVSTSRFCYIENRFAKDESYDLEKINEVINLYKFEGPYKNASPVFIIYPSE